MINFKTLLLTATIVAGAAASPAFAQLAPNPVQVPLPAPVNAGELRGAGATSVERIVVRNLNCIGPDSQRGASAAPGTLITVPPGLFTGPSPAITQDCSLEANNIQANIAGKYIATGSGFGRRVWRDLDNSFTGGTTGRAQAGVINPFGTWANVQFGYSDTPVQPGDLTTYTSRAAPKAGPAITFPLYILPVAIAYSNVYGVNASGTNMVFNALGTGIGNSTTAPVAAIRLARAAYCGIFNGTITNWNHPALTFLNKKTPLFDPALD